MVAATDRTLDARRIDRVARGVDIDQHWRRTRGNNRGDGRQRRVRDRDHFVARPDAEPPQRQDQRIGAAADANRMCHATIFGKGALETLDLLARDT